MCVIFSSERRIWSIVKSNTSSTYIQYIHKGKSELATLHHGPVCIQVICINYPVASLMNIQ